MPVAHIVAADEVVPRAPTKRELLLVQRELWLACLVRLEAHTDALIRWLPDFERTPVRSRSAPIAI